MPVLERPWARRAEAAATARQFLAEVARTLVGAAKRSGALVLAAFEASRSDERLAPLAAQFKAQRAVTASWIVDRIAARAPLRLDRSQAIDTIWLLMDPAGFDRLTAHRGWSAHRYGAWFVHNSLRLLTEQQ